MSRLPPLVVFAGCVAACSSETQFVHQSQTDLFQQSPNDQVDILFVVDDSNSMAEEQQALVDGFTGFIRSLEDTNSKFQIGVISTSADSDDPRAGALLGSPPFLTVRDDYVAEFAQRARVGTEGSDKEKGLEAAVRALSPEMLQGPNRDFLRDDAHLLVAVVSDEEDCSDDGALDGFEASTCYSHGDHLPPVEHFVEQLVDAKGGRADLVSFGAIIGPTLNGGCETAWPGLRYAEAVQLVGGVIGDICTADWSGMLSTMGLTATGIVRDFPLTSAAVPESLVVTVDAAPVLEDERDGWTYDVASATLTFHGLGVPERGAEIVVEYEVQPM